MKPQYLTIILSVTLVFNIAVFVIALNKSKEPPKTKGGNMHYFKPDIERDTVSDYISNCGGHCWRSPWQNH
jgi:hypothetical protein